MSVSKLLSHWRSDPSIGGNIVYWHSSDSQMADYQGIPSELHPSLLNGLTNIGIEALYSHQMDSWKHISKGKNIAIVTGTASGKTICYNLPVLDKLIRDRHSSALYLFPTKALAHDQLSAIQSLLSHDKANLDSIAPETYDGDTVFSSRPKIRHRSRLVITNPDMLHTGILPHHSQWNTFFQDLRYVIIDEMHTYRGVFGSHVANVIRRMKRIAGSYNHRIQFILTSATIGNPKVLAEKLTDSQVVLIDNDGSSRGATHFLIYNPPIINPELGLRASLIQECVRIVKELQAYDIQTILFGRTRRSVEILLRYLNFKGNQIENEDQENLTIENNTLMTTRAYRSGYLPKDRREIEQRLRNGKIRTVVATTALELGVDIGGMDAVVLAGYPGTIAGTWQQAGRAGRKQDSSLVVFVASSNPLDQFLANHPEYLFEQNPEKALIDPNNILILLEHLKCAVFEKSFHKGNPFGSIDPDTVAEFLEVLNSSGVLYKSNAQFHWMSNDYPASNVSIRSASPEIISLQIKIAGNLKTIGVVDRASASWMVHQNAVYLHEGISYLVESLDLDGKVAYLAPIDADYYTRPQQETTVALIEQKAKKTIGGGVISHGEILVTSQVTGYKMITWSTQENIGFGEVNLPPTDLLTNGYWICLPKDTVTKLYSEGFWSSSSNNYGSNWLKQRKRALERDGYRCQVCGALEGESHHHVHHMRPFKTFQNYLEANHINNLITLCANCHRKAEKVVRIRSGLSGLSYTLSHIAPLFLMCDNQDIGVYSDPQSPLTNGLPTIVIYERIPAGVGFSQQLYEIHRIMVQHAHDLVSQCECQNGCPSCVGPGGELGYANKDETLAILRLLAH
jgi:DEAD/DEAH box helicase domain-containing protein